MDCLKIKRVVNMLICRIKFKKLTEICLLTNYNILMKFSYCKFENNSFVSMVINYNECVYLNILSYTKTPVRSDKARSF